MEEISAEKVLRSIKERNITTYVHLKTIQLSRSGLEQLSVTKQTFMNIRMQDRCQKIHLEVDNFHAADFQDSEFGPKLSLEYQGKFVIDPRALDRKVTFGVVQVRPDDSQAQHEVATGAISLSSVHGSYIKSFNLDLTSTNASREFRKYPFGILELKIEVLDESDAIQKIFREIELIKEQEQNAAARKREYDFIKFLRYVTPVMRLEKFLVRDIYGLRSFTKTFTFVTLATLAIWFYWLLPALTILFLIWTIIVSKLHKPQQITVNINRYDYKKSWDYIKHSTINYCEQVDSTTKFVNQSVLWGNEQQTQKFLNYLVKLMIPVLIATYFIEFRILLIGSLWLSLLGRVYILQGIFRYCLHWVLWQHQKIRRALARFRRRKRAQQPKSPKPPSALSVESEERRLLDDSGSEIQNHHSIEEDEEGVVPMEMMYREPERKTFEIYENERRWMFRGWVPLFFPAEGVFNWSSRDPKTECSKLEAALPGDDWEWDDPWHTEVNDNTDPEGWSYAWSFKKLEKFHPVQSGSDFARRRLWLRSCKRTIVEKSLRHQSKLPFETKRGF